ncbi:hypothetical protein B0H17DRAFT_1065609 [Mycena rosella]|uniref:Uncharacterized protein n=1 Tax=Mycena rosella TaxID=1033263 RepID=A0AAD7DF08_MYCRO|nr:hypothetical protein B0H17DRAFT_1065609 [Mycena rosella]
MRRSDRQGGRRRLWYRPHFSCLRPPPPLRGSSLGVLSNIYPEPCTRGPVSHCALWRRAPSCLDYCRATVVLDNDNLNESHIPLTFLHSMLQNQCSKTYSDHKLFFESPCQVLLQEKLSFVFRTRRKRVNVSQDFSLKAPLESKSALLKHVEMKCCHEDGSRRGNLCWGSGGGPKKKKIRCVLILSPLRFRTKLILGHFRVHYEFGEETAMTVAMRRMGNGRNAFCAQRLSIHVPSNSIANAI